MLLAVLVFVMTLHYGRYLKLTLLVKAIVKILGGALKVIVK